VDIKGIFISLMERLSKFAVQLSQQHGDNSQGGNVMLQISKDLDIFRLFKKYTDKIIA